MSTGTITLTPEAAEKIRFTNNARASIKFDGIQGQWDGRAKLTTRDGNPIHAPAWWTKQLPRKKLVGELWMGNNTFSEVQSVVTRKTPDDSRWQAVKFMIFEGTAPEAENVSMVRQLPVTGGAHVRQFAEAVIAKGGEGAIVLDRGTLYKIKAVADREAVVVGHIEGNGRLRGLVGALEAKDGAILFRLGAGLTDSMRRTPPKVGAVITYTFTGRHPSGIPRFPAFLRVREAA